MDDEREQYLDLWRERVSTNRFFYWIYLVQGFAFGAGVGQVFHLLPVSSLYFSGFIIAICAVTLVVLRRKMSEFRRKCEEHWKQARSFMLEAGMEVPEKMPEDPQGWLAVRRALDDARPDKPKGATL
jgi:membrane protein implicated in regulation of membrane protease activity